jgi:hypothetical protein
VGRFNAEFFAQFPYQCLYDALARFNLAARQFPPAWPGFIGWAFSQ